jgi:guanosine-3',5'-bis(diphosphate) 3'-pyrophosphohydrolase
MTVMQENEMLTSRLLDAAVFAAEQHQYQRRNGYDRLPYVNHLLKVTEALFRIGGVREADILVAAVLHDILEDTSLSHSDLAGRFGKKAADIVQELTDDMRLPYMERKRLQWLHAPYLSDPAKMIRLTDKACNIRDIMDYPLDWEPERKLDYIQSAEKVVERLQGINEPLEAWFYEEAGRARKILS